MTGPIFVDSNVLIYARDRAAHAKQERAASWLEYLWASRRGRLSFQVLQEFYVNATQKLTPRVPAATAREEVRDLIAWGPLPLDEALLEQAFRFQDQSRLSFWDALIVSAAHATRCSVLLTEDLQHGQKLGDLTVLSPFRTDVPKG